MVYDVTEYIFDESALLWTELFIQKLIKKIKLNELILVLNMLTWFLRSIQNIKIP